MTEIVIWYTDKNGQNKSEKFESRTKEFSLFRKGTFSIDLVQFVQYPQMETLDLARNQIEKINLTPLIRRMRR